MITHDIFNIVTNIIDYSLYCSSKPSHWVGCAGFWAFVYLSGAFIAFIFFCIAAKKLWTEHKEMKAYEAKKARQAFIADSETMAKHVWHGE